MATNPVTRKLAFNTMTPEPVGARRPSVNPNGQRMHPTNHTLDDYMWVATLEENWGVDLWPALFTQAVEQELSTMTQLREMIRPARYTPSSTASTITPTRLT
eukprot:6179439-Pleurochrysis_carterae.AAC.1